ncbi:hypothetical protein [Robertkochia flava]|uniref:hypothetical protein n=1 Tax=Robertkochia flava TaxID=3447986 RepID=UPI001CCE4362|nr:hypothetical protein [Robertkochia marina]
MRNIGLLLSFLVSFGFAFAQHGAGNVNDIRDMRAGSAEEELERMGYDLSSVDKTSTGIYQYWYNSRLGRCVQSTIYNGRVVHVKAVEEGKCGQGYDEGRRELNMTSMRGMNEVHVSSRLQREGYRVVSTDGKGAGRVDMYWYNSRTRQCLRMEVDDDVVRDVRYTSTSYCTNAGNRPEESYSKGSGRTSLDFLQGWGAIKAYDRLADEGFRETKNHKDGGKTYRVWYNSRTGECVKTLSQKEKITEIILSNRCD